MKIRFWAHKMLYSIIRNNMLSDQYTDLLMINTLALKSSLNVLYIHPGVNRSETKISTCQVYMEKFEILKITWNIFLAVYSHFNIHTLMQWLLEFDLNHNLKYIWRTSCLWFIYLVSIQINKKSKEILGNDLVLFQKKSHFEMIDVYYTLGNPRIQHLEAWLLLCASAITTLIIKITEIITVMCTNHGSHKDGIFEN